MWIGRLPLGLRLLTSRSLPCWETLNRSRLQISGKSMQQASSSQLHIGSDDHTFYNYTSGRWLYNETSKIHQRYLRFDAEELCNIVAKSVGQRADDIKIFTKIAEGGSYRVFEATFQDGLKIIARLPYPCSVPHKYGTASEVATMEFLRLHGVPIPRVFDWNDTSANPIGSEYIIMERVLGKELEESWYTMSIKERMAVIEKIVDIERILFTLEFPASGGLFFDKSLDDSMDRVEIETLLSVKNAPKFCIGPSTEYLWWYQNRNELGINSGPWKSTTEVLKAVGERELAWMKKFAKRRYPRELLYRELYEGQMVEPDVQIRNLLDYLEVAPFIAPRDLELGKPCIRHPDLSPNNIFVSDSGDITGVIDWQHSIVLPIFLQAKIPKHFQNYGDEDSENFMAPRLPYNFDSLSEVEKDTAMELYRRRQVHYFYIGHTSHLNPSHFHAMGSHDLILRNRLYDAAGRPWEGDNTSLKAELIRVSKLWYKIFPPSSSETQFPVSYSDVEMEECLAIDEKQKVADSKMQAVRDFIGVNIDGWIPSDLYDEAVAKEEHIRKQVIDAAETDDERKDIEENWPFQDHEELD